MNDNFKYTDDPILNLNSKRVIRVAKPQIEKEDKEAVLTALDANEVALGSSVQKFEEAFAKSHSVKYGSSCNSGTSALILALAALDVWELDQVLIPAFSMIAIANSVLIRRADPVFIDSSERNLIGNVSLDTIKEAIKTMVFPPKAIILQHTYGEIIRDVKEIAKFCKEKEIYLIEDCCESPFSKIEGRSVGTFGDISVFSFYANKHLTTGEGGMCISNNSKLIDKINTLKAHAFSHNCHFSHTSHAYGLRLSNMAASLGLSQLSRIDSIMRRRIEIRYLYQNRLDKYYTKTIEPSLLIPDSTKTSSHWVMPLLAGNQEIRDNLRKTLANEGVETRSFFIPCNRQKFLTEFIREKQTFKTANSLSEMGFYLPLYPSLSDEDINYICDIIDNYYENN